MLVSKVEKPRFQLIADSMVHTNATILVQIEVQESLQTMLEGSYKSGKSTLDLIRKE